MSFCEVYLDDPRGVYFPGNQIKGKAICAFSKSEYISGIRLILVGSEHTNWSEWDDDRQDRTVLYYTGDRDFLTEKLELANTGEYGPGQASFPFSFHLPKTLPGTYHGKYGWVKYIVKLIVDRPNEISYRDEKEIQVVSLVDFNAIKSKLRLHPVTNSGEKTLCCWCCASGPIILDVQLEKGAFVQGETVKVHVNVVNGSWENVDLVIAELGMGINFTAQFPRPKNRRDYELLAVTRNAGVQARGKSSYTFLLEIPQAVGVPNFDLCNLFSRWCTVKVTACTSMWHTNLAVPIDVFIGHVPVGDDVKVLQQRILEQVSNVRPPELPQEVPQSVAGIETVDGNTTESAVLLPHRPIIPVIEPIHAPPSENAVLPTPTSTDAIDRRNDSATGTGTTNHNCDYPPPSYEEATGQK